jgi:hypothetical protein
MTMDSAIMESGVHIFGGNLVDVYASLSPGRVQQFKAATARMADDVTA